MWQNVKYQGNKGKKPDLVESSRSQEITQQQGDDADTREGFINRMELIEKKEPRRDTRRGIGLTISVVPAHARAFGRERYEPYHVSIGPHHRDSAKDWVEAQKESCLQFLLGHGEITTTREFWESMYETVMELQNRYGILECYRLDNEKKLGNRNLVCMLVLDACYLIVNFGIPYHVKKEYLINNFGGHQEDNANASKEDPNWNDLVRDTWYLLENQMPFCVVEEIGTTIVTKWKDGEIRGEFMKFSKTLLQFHNYIFTEENQDSTNRSRSELNTGNDPPAKENGSPKQLRHYLILEKQDVADTESTGKAGLFGQGSNNNLSRAGPSNLELARVRSGRESTREDDSPQHLLGMLHTMLKPKPLKRKEVHQTKAHRSWRRATDYLCNSNVQFVRRPLCSKESPTVLDVGIHSGPVRMKVQIPCLHIDNNTWTMLVNLMALEQQRGSQLRIHHVTAYCMFLSQMACTAEDVKLLQSCDVITTSLGSPDKVAESLRDLCNGIHFSVENREQNYLYPILEELEKRYQCRTHNIISSIRLKYWSDKDIAVMIGVITGFILLVGGVVSAVFAVLSYIQDRSQKTPGRAP